MKLLTLLLLLTSFLYSELIIVTNSKSTINSLSKESIKYLYLAKVNKIKGIKIKPLLSKDTTLHEEFVRNIINKNILQYNSYWTRLVFTGRKSIPMRLNKEDIDEKLLEINTIIYIRKEDFNANWKIIYEEK